MFRAFILALTVTLAGGVTYLHASAAPNVSPVSIEISPTSIPSSTPTLFPSLTPTLKPSPSSTPTIFPTSTSTPLPSPQPTSTPTPTTIPTRSPSPSLRPTSVPTSTPTTSPTRTPTPSPTSTYSPTPTQTITVTTFTSAQVYEFTNQYGAEYKVDPNVLRYIAICETGFNPLAKNSLYAGMYQYSATTWSSYRNQMHLDPNPDLRLNAQEAIRTTAYVLSKGGSNNWPNCYPK